MLLLIKRSKDAVYVNQSEHLFADEHIVLWENAGGIHDKWMLRQCDFCKRTVLKVW